jgi:RNA methyltransferase, TrmH family
MSAMPLASVQDLSSRDNPLVARVRRLARGGTAYRKERAVWLEGEHLCSALRAHGRAASHALISEAAWQRPALRALAQHAPQVARVPDALFAQLSTLETPGQGIGFLLPLDVAPPVAADAPTLVLDRVQDAGNAGSLLRSAAALGFTQVLALEGSAGLWSPKVLRAGMGAHFGLRLVEGLGPATLDALAVPLLAASAHAAHALHEVPLPFPCAWVLGHEGQGVAAAIEARCTMVLRIPQPGGEESLNVAAAGAICLYATRQSAGWPA